MAAKLGIVEEEADETIYWLELLIEAKISDSEEPRALTREADEILCMVVASIRTLKRSPDRA